ncbi:hypothetical protein HanXRQr2_Chr09g0389111 [Helianthus annuus]|uniref:Uncharacterized protein n=1 Tax=Helianthus annuus TaxID=4232 RepID=A0A9K3I6G2_HELAN|nr:hypothetical protein HanXRQr2_Chr09g0389111 [Helianthus annuus]
MPLGFCGRQWCSTAVNKQRRIGPSVERPMIVTNHYGQRNLRLVMTRNTREI